MWCAYQVSWAHLNGLQHNHCLTSRQYHGSRNTTLIFFFHFNTEGKQQENKKKDKHTEEETWVWAICIAAWDRDVFWDGIPHHSSKRFGKDGAAALFIHTAHANTTRPKKGRIALSGFCFIMASYPFWFLTHSHYPLLLPLCPYTVSPFILARCCSTFFFVIHAGDSDGSNSRGAR